MAIRVRWYLAEGLSCRKPAPWPAFPLRRSRGLFAGAWRAGERAISKIKSKEEMWVGRRGAASDWNPGRGICPRRRGTPPLARPLRRSWGLFAGAWRAGGRARGQGDEEEFKDEVDPRVGQRWLIDCFPKVRWAFGGGRRLLRSLGGDRPAPYVELSCFPGSPGGDALRLAPPSAWAGRSALVLAGGGVSGWRRGRSRRWPCVAPGLLPGWEGRR